MTKICTNCKQEKEIGSFSWRSQRLCKRNSWCKECHKKVHRNRWRTDAKYRINHKKQFVKDRQKIREYIVDYLNKHPCVDCGETNILCLEFDHVRGEKEFSVTEVIRNGQTKKLEIEIAKCDVVCSNCHKIRTANRCNNFKVRTKNLQQNPKDSV